MTRFSAAAALGLALAVLAAPPANAYPAEEQALMTATGKAGVARIFTGAAEAKAACDNGAAQLTSASPKYLWFLVERCLGAVAETDADRCQHYRRAVAIWAASPPPVDPDDEDWAITRAGFLHSMKDDLAVDCRRDAQPQEDPNAYVVPPTPGAVVETQEGIAYALPAGFGVTSFHQVGGGVTLRNAASGETLTVGRVGLGEQYTREAEYPERERLASGALLEWVHKPAIPGASIYVLNGRVTLPTTYVTLSMRTDSAVSPTGANKASSLAAFRQVAETVRVVGPRRCIGDCGPGIVKAAN